MVAARKRPATNEFRSPREARNVVKRTAQAGGPLIDARTAPRLRVAQRAWLCATDGSIRGYALDLSIDGGRFGGAGTRLEVGAQLIVKLVLDEREPPLVLKAEVVRYAPALHCPQLCLKFLAAPGDERARLSAFLEKTAKPARS